MDYECGAISGLECGGVVSRRSQTCGLSRLSVHGPHLRLANDAFAGLEPVGFGQCHFVDNSVGGFHVAAKPRPVELDGYDEPAGTESHKLAESGRPSCVGWKQLLPAHALKINLELKTL